MMTNEIERAFYKFWGNYTADMDDKTLENTVKFLRVCPKALNDMLREEYEYRELDEYREQINNG
jgi:hypothetical protein